MGIGEQFELEKTGRILPENIAKGNIHGECNRTVCKTKDAIYFNHSTLKYYCKDCADVINKANHEYAMKIFGHDLCMKSGSVR